MSVVGRIESLWRYPVKSMAGDRVNEAFVGLSGIRGDRIYAFKSSKCPRGLPYLSAREQEQMLRYRPRFRDARPDARPDAPPAELDVDVVTPSGDVLAIDDPDLVRMLGDGLDGHELTLVRSDRAITDCHPVSILGVQTAQALGRELGVAMDQRRFRANIYVDFTSGAGFAEDGYVGRRLRLGAAVEVLIVERDKRCKVITLDPDTIETDARILRAVNQGHEGRAGVYAAVLVEGTVRVGDEVEVLAAS